MPKTRKIENDMTPGTGAAAPAPVRRRTAAAGSARKPAANRASKAADVEASAPTVTESVAEFLEPVAIETVEVLEAIVVAAPAFEPTHDQIAALAYSYWVNRGYQAGNPREDWLRAESELRQRA